MSIAESIEELRQTARKFWELGWSRGTSSNYSVVVSREPLRLLVTASGKDKSRLQSTDFLIVGSDGKAAEPTSEKPSAETGLHLVIAELPGVGAILHTHSVWGTVLTDYYRSDGFELAGFEMLKGLAGVTSHEHREWIPIVENDQDIPRMANLLRPRLQGQAERPISHGFLIRRHGLYTWGKDLAEARRHIEIFEFLFEVHVRRLTLDGGDSLL